MYVGESFELSSSLKAKHSLVNITFCYKTNSFHICVVSKAHFIRSQQYHFIPEYSEFLRRHYSIHKFEISESLHDTQ